MKREPLKTDLPDSFDSLLRAAVDISDVPLAPPALSSLSAGVTLGSGAPVRPYSTNTNVDPRATLLEYAPAPGVVAVHRHRPPCVAPAERRK